MSTATAAAAEYKLTLDELVNNNKTQINLLTILAEDYLGYASYIVDTIEKQVYTVPKEQKLPILYVTDSILKNVNNGPYRNLFQKIIIKIFLHVFVNGDEKVRMSLYKLRQTWSDIFPASCLYKMDMEVNKEDKQWPISSPKAAGRQTAAPTSPQIHVNPKFLPKPAAPTARDPRGPRTRVPIPEPPKKKVVEVKKEPPSDPQGTRDVFSCRDNIMSLPSGRPIKEEPEEPLPPPPAVKKTSPHQAPKRRVTDEARSAPPSKKRSPGPLDEDLRMPRRPTAAARVSPTPTATAATALPGAHAFSVPVIACTSGSSPNINMSPAFTEGFPPAPQAFPPVPAFTPMPATSTSSFFPPPVAAAPTKPVEISHDTGMKLEGIPANNRIFVDGKAHEVFYIDDSAVIERNGLPHRIYFAGPPRNVIIDGVAHMLRFNEKKTIYIDGQAHVLRFGAPSKELYMGNYPFKGQFGGAPIIAIIDNVRHEIRLGGPAPEVKIEPEPAYDLTRFMPQIREGRPAEPAKPVVENPFELLQRLKQSGFLDRSKVPASESRPNSSSNNNNAHGERTRATPPKKKEGTPPIPSEHTFDSVERKLAPSNSLRDFNMRLLKIRYEAIVEALHEKQRNACPQCGLRMELQGEKYERHLDWHVKKNLQTLERTSTSRPWYASSKDWLSNEDDEIPGTSTSADVKEEEALSEPAISSEDAPNKDCTVCGEKFEEYFDEDDDVWKLRSTVVVNERVVHVNCVQDVSMAEPSLQSACASSSDPEYVVEEKALKIVSSH